MAGYSTSTPLPSLTSPSQKSLEENEKSQRVEAVVSTRAPHRFLTQFITLSGERDRAHKATIMIRNVS